MIKVQNLVKRYGNTVAVKGISFSVAKGEVLGFLGPNGAGKTTTMRILTCYMPPDEGSVSIDGLDIFKESLQVRKNIGYLPENAPLYEDMGVIEYLKFIAEMRGIPSNERDKQVKKMVSVCGLEKVVGKQIAHLSKGYRQRVGLAQTMIHEPDLLILDEPTSGLDPNQIKEIRELIKSIGEEKTVILCTHILQEVSMTCNRVIIINEGSIVASGTPDELSAQAASGKKVYLGIRGNRENIETVFSGKSQIIDFKFMEKDQDGFYRYLITGEKNSKMGHLLYSMSVENKFEVNEISPSEESLEDIFLKLTKGEK